MKTKSLDWSWAQQQQQQQQQQQEGQQGLCQYPCARLLLLMRWLKGHQQLRPAFSWGTSYASK
jgi:hypothetical protein